MGLVRPEKKSVIANVVVDIYTPKPHLALHIDKTREILFMIETHSYTHTLDGSSSRQSEQIVST